jgi:disulfide bond formation protein DsbB
MCWWQRYAHFAALGLAVAAWCCLRRLAVALAGLALATAALIGGYHAGVEYGWWKGITECTSAVSFAGGGDPLAAIMAAPVIRCDVVQWKLFGISMAGLIS